MPQPLLPPTRRGTIRVPHEQRDYEVQLYAPHLFALEINAAEPRFATAFAVNLGAGDGVSCNDPVFPLFRAGFAGLAVDAGSDPALFSNLPAPSICKVQGTPVTPGNVVALLDAGRCPERPDFFKIDIDGYDGPVLLEVLKAGYRPKVIQAEVQPEIPPPLEFAVLYDPSYRCQDDRQRQGGFYGASLAYIANLGRRFGYFPVQLDFVSAFTHDVTLVDARYRQLIQDGFGVVERSDRALFLAHPPGYSHFREDDGIDTSTWRWAADPHALLRAVWAACLSASQRKHGRALPFALAVS